MQIKLESGETLFLDSNNIPSGPGFDDLYQTLVIENIPGSVIKEIGYLYRKSFKHSNMLLELALETVQDRQDNIKDVTEIKIEMIGLLMNHKKDPLDLFNELSDIQDKRLDLLRAFYQLTVNGFEDAMFLFNKIGYKKGVEICKLKMGEYEDASRSADFTIRCYADTKEWPRTVEDYRMRVNAATDRSRYDSNNSGKNDKRKSSIFKPEYETENINCTSVQYENMNKNFLFRIGATDEAEDSNNVDVKIEKARRELKRMENNLYGNSFIGYLKNNKLIEKSRAEHILEELKTLPKSAEVLYLMGKVNHLSGDSSSAVMYYKEALKKDGKYFPAELNLKRIEENTINSNCQGASDYIALSSLVKCEYNVDVSNCNDDVKRIWNFVTGCRKLQCPDLLEKAVRLELDYACLFKPEVLYNNLAVIFYNKGVPSTSNFSRKDLELNFSDKKDLIKDKRLSVVIDLLNKAEGCNNPEYQNIIKYNLGVITSDLDLLRDSPFVEAQDHITLISKDSERASDLLQGYILMQDKAKSDFSEAKEKFMKFLELNSKNQSKNEAIHNQKLFAGICLGSIAINHYLETGSETSLDEAISLFKSNCLSFYFINGLAVCYALKGFYSAAVRLLIQVVDDCNESIFNLAKVYILMGNHKRAAESLLRANAHIGMIKDLCRKSKDLKLVEKAISFGIKGLENLRAELLLEKGDVEAAREASPEIDRAIKEQEESRKRKLAELEEYRKRLHFD